MIKDTDSLCWDCANAVPDLKHGCPWSMYEQPVKGWETIDYGTAQGSQTVVSCPLFTPDEKGEIHGDIQPLFDAIVKRAAVDYLHACKVEAMQRKEFPNWRVWRQPFMEPWRRWVDVPMKPSDMVECERFFTSQYGMMMTDSDLTYIMDRIRKECGLEPFESIRT